MPASDARALASLRTILHRAHYDDEGLERIVRDDGRTSLPEGLAALRLRPDAGSPLAVLARLFLGGETLERALVARILDPLEPEELGNVLWVQSGGVHARARIEPFDGLLIASDWQRRIRPGHVLGVGGGTRMLAALTVRRRVEAALDLCTGSGTLALLAARHAARVVGVDLNPRALRLARVNAELNGVTTVDWRRGDLYQPVADEQFDLVVANPPFVVSPSSEFLFRDGGQDEDALSRAVVAGAAARLREGGFAQVMCSWVAPARGLMTKPLRAWVRGLGCDAWLLTYRTETPSAYAIQWNLRPGRTLAAAAVEAQGWVDYYRARGIEAIATGVVVLRRRSGRNWVREDTMARRPIGAAGAHVERVFAAQDLLHSLKDDRELLTLRLVAAPKTKVVERREPTGAFERARLTVEEGLPLVARIPEDCLPVLAALDGRRTLAKALQKAAVAPDAVVPTLRELVARGLLVAA